MGAHLCLDSSAHNGGIFTQLIVNRMNCCVHPGPVTMKLKLRVLYSPRSYCPSEISPACLNIQAYSSPPHKQSLFLILRIWRVTKWGEKIFRDEACLAFLHRLHTTDFVIGWRGRKKEKNEGQKSVQNMAIKTQGGGGPVSGSTPRKHWASGCLYSHANSVTGAPPGQFRATYQIPPHRCRTYQTTSTHASNQRVSRTLTLIRKDIYNSRLVNTRLGCFIIRWLVSWIVGLFLGWLVKSFIGFVVGWLIGWLVEWLIGLLVGLLVG